MAIKLNEEGRNQPIWWLVLGIFWPIRRTISCPCCFYFVTLTGGILGGTCWWMERTDVSEVGNRIKLARTCCYNLIQARLLGLANDVACPAPERPIVHIRWRSVIQSAYRTLASIFRGRNVVQIPAAVECPVEGHRCWIRFNLAD